MSSSRKVVYCVLAIVFLVILRETLFNRGHQSVRSQPYCEERLSSRGLSNTALNKQITRPAYLTEHIVYNASGHSSVPFEAPEPLQHRYPDSIDTFETYKYRNTCNISSLELHTPFAPLCPDRASMVEAMSGGGRIGFDAPYMPRGCDMRWFTTEEVCEILSRFEKVIIVGDSMMRHVIGSINVMVRKDLGYGAVTDWNFSPDER